MRSPLAAYAGVSAVDDKAIAPIATAAKVRLLITFHSLKNCRAAAEGLGADKDAKA